MYFRRGELSKWYLVQLRVSLGYLDYQKLEAGKGKLRHFLYFKIHKGIFKITFLVNF